MSVTLLHTPVLQKQHKDIWSRLITFWVRKELTLPCLWLTICPKRLRLLDLMDCTPQNRKPHSWRCQTIGTSRWCWKQREPTFHKELCKHWKSHKIHKTVQVCRDSISIRVFRCNGSSQLGRIYGIALWCLVSPWSLGWRQTTWQCPEAISAGASHPFPQ